MAWCVKTEASSRRSARWPAASAGSGARAGRVLPANPVATLEDKPLFISGGSRGIGLAIALRAARDGANIAIVAKTTEPHPRLEGTIHTAAKQIEAAGG